MNGVPLEKEWMEEEEEEEEEGEEKRIKNVVYKQTCECFFCKVNPKEEEYLNNQRRRDGKRKREKRGRSGE